MPGRDRICIERFRLPVKDALPPNFSREMGLTFREFLRTLPAAIEPLTFQLDGRAITIIHPEGRILIDLHETGERRIASMRLPVTRVDFQFNGLEAGERKTFMDRFDLYFHRGGG
jgi:hypothetical protein